MQVSKRTIKPPWTELGTVLQQAVISQKIDFVRCLLELGLVELLFRLQPFKNHYHIMLSMSLSAIISICMTPLQDVNKFHSHFNSSLL